RQDGYLFLLDREEDVATFRTGLALQQSLGVPSRELTPEEARAIVPQLEVGDLLAATYCARDGYATPEAVVQHYARESGARIRQGCAALAVDVRDARIVGVETTEGRIATECVVCCAGGWSR